MTAPKTLVLDLRTWDRIYQQLAAEYPPSYLIIREKMRRELGFTVRRHACWVYEPDHSNSRSGYYRDEIHLDFYAPGSDTFFVLKYLHTADPD
jgi:hypothetical protein